MNHSPAEVVRQLLINLGLGSVAAYSENLYTGSPWPVFADAEPNSPDECITVRDTVGTGGARSMPTGEVFGHSGFQVRVRARDHSTGWRKADAIASALAEDVYQESVTISGSSYLVHCVAGIGDVLPLGKETPTSKRSLFTLNAVAAIREL